MKNFNGTPEEIWAERKRLCKEYGINMIKAGCYLNNYYDDFLCSDYSCVAGCEKIRVAEGEKSVGESGEDVVEEHIQDGVTEATDVGGSLEDIGEETGE